MGMKPPKKIAKPNTPDADQPVRNPPAEDGTAPRRDLPDTGISGRHPDDQSAANPPGSEGEADNSSRQPLVVVADVSTSGPVAGSSTGASSDISFLPSFLGANLPAPLADGLRYGKRQTVYAEIENQGLTLVRLDDNGEYRVASASELNASGPVLERVAGTAFWRRKKTDDQPGPSKRPRLDEDTRNLPEANPLLAVLLAQPSSPLDLSAALWRNWGSTTKPLTGESLEINGLHYRVVPHGTPERTGIAYLEHPRFSPSRYEAFEQMLHDDPSLQPRWAVKKNGQWEVLENHLPFEKSLTGYVAETFRYFSDDSLTNVARSLFNRANHSDVINSPGLMVLNQTFRHWGNASSARPPRRELADPLLMLPVIARTTNNGWLSLAPSDAVGALRRLDFAPAHFPVEWNSFLTAPSNSNLKRLVSSVLVRNGYDVFPLTSEDSGPTLVFTRANHDAVYFLKLGRIDGYLIRDITPPGNELSDPHLTTRIGEPARAALRAAYDQNKVVWLLGGTQTTASGWQSVFIIREG